MRYFVRNDLFKPKNCIWGLRLREGIILEEDEWIRMRENGKNRRWDRAGREEGTETLKRREEMRERSLKMTSKWDNTLAKLKEVKREKELREAGKAEEEKSMARKKTQRRKKKEKERTLREAYRLVYENKSTTQQLLSGASLSAIIEERNRQVDFNASLKTKMKEEFAEQVDRRKDQAAQMEKQLEEEKLRRLKLACEVRKALDKQMSEAERKRQESEWEKEKEKEILKRRNCLLKQMENAEREGERKSKENLKLRIERYLRSEEGLRKERERMEEVESKMREVVQEVTYALEKKRKARERSFRSGVSIKCLEMLEKRRKEEEEKAEREREKTRVVGMEKDERKREELIRETKRKEGLRRERVADRRRAERERDRRRAEESGRAEEERRAREERSRRDERWGAAERRGGRARKEAVSAWLKGQMEEAAERREAERRAEEEWEQAWVVGRAEREREDVGAYCEYVVEEAKRRGRPLCPVLAAVKNVKMECGIIEPKRRIDHLESKVKFNMDSLSKEISSKVISL